MTFDGLVKSRRRSSALRWYAARHATSLVTEKVLADHKSLSRSSAFPMYVLVLRHVEKEPPRGGLLFLSCCQ